MSPGPLHPTPTWCGESVTIAFVSPGGVVYHLAGWRLRVTRVGQKDG